MIRINLLPPEITQRRKDERLWRWIGLGAAIVVVLLAGIFVIVSIEVSLKQNEVDSIQQQAEGLRQQSNRFRVFAVKQSDLEARKAVVKSALTGRMDWSRLLAEVALVLPGDLFLTAMQGNEPKAAAPVVPAQPAGGDLTIAGKALDYPDDVPDLGYKSVAKMLVRLAELDQLDNVWMSDSAKPVSSSAPGQTTVDPYIVFGVVAKLPTSSTPPPSAAGVSALPTP